MSVRAPISTSNRPRPSRIQIKVNGTTHHTVDYRGLDDTLLKVFNDIASISGAIQQPATRATGRAITDYVMPVDQEVLIADATNAPFTVTLPDASQIDNQTRTVTRVNPAPNIVTVKSKQQPIHSTTGVSTQVQLLVQGQTLHFHAHAGEWYVV